jgi:hypothetical protein
MASLGAWGAVCVYTALHVITLRRLSPSRCPLIRPEGAAAPYRGREPRRRCDAAASCGARHFNSPCRIAVDSAPEGVRERAKIIFLHQRD